MSLAEAFDPRRNALNAFRLVLASLVIVSHSWLLSGYGLQPHLGGMDLGTWAVIGFFGISGFLITRSRMSGTSARDYYWNRALRLLPGFLVCLLVIAFVLAPISVLLAPGSSYSLPSAVGYVLSNLPLSATFISQKTIEGTLIGIPVAGYWNGPVWTLFWEACCYLIVGFLVSVVRRRHVGVAVAALFGVSTVAVALTTLGVLEFPALVEGVFPLFAAFFAGSMAFFFRHAIDVSWPVLVACSLVIVAAVLVNFASVLVAFPLTLLLLWCSGIVPLYRVGTRNDISYGIYIYGWPVQQLILLVAYGNGMPVGWFAALSVVCTVPLAYLSCIGVERPALKLKRRKGSPLSQPAPSA